MLPLPQKIAFLIFAAVTATLGAIGFYGNYARIRRGAQAAESRTNHSWRRLLNAAVVTVLQTRTFRKRPAISIFHAFIAYGFAFYVFLNVVDLVEGYIPFTIRSTGFWSSAYNLCADILSPLVLIGVVALVVRRYLVPSRRDFAFNQRTPLHEEVGRRWIQLDSAVVSAFIIFHVGSRTLEEASKLRLEGGDRLQPSTSFVSGWLPAAHARGLAELGYWGALGSVFAFLAYFPWSKHVHIFMAPLKYFFAREAGAGVLPLAATELGDDADGQIGAARLEDLAWPRLLDAYACIQCNRCQDVCPASVTGKALSPAALEINKRMELNGLTRGLLSGVEGGFERGEPSPRPLLQFALSPEALWACTTCGACMEVCPVQDEQMLDIIDIRRNEVMMEGRFPVELQSAFRGMERNRNPWGLSRSRRMEWAEGLSVKTIAENPEPEVLYWVGCAASYDPQAQRTARALARLFDLAEVNWAVLGEREGCTGDSARRAGNELLYRTLAKENIALIDSVKPKRIVTACPHCMNALGREYRQLGGNYNVAHHTQFLEELVQAGRLKPQRTLGRMAFHDPCYLGRMNGIYEPPRNVLRRVSGDLVELERNRSHSFCCGAGGAQFWKEEEPGKERIAANRMREAEGVLGSGPGEKVLAVGCPFCKNMLGGSIGDAGERAVQVRDVAELLLESIGERIESRETAQNGPAARLSQPSSGRSTAGNSEPADGRVVSPPQTAPPPAASAGRKPWKPKTGG